MVLQGDLERGTSKLPGEDCGIQSGECSQPVTLRASVRQPAVHALFLSRFLHAGRWLNEASQRPVQAICADRTKRSRNRLSGLRLIVSQQKAEVGSAKG